MSDENIEYTLDGLIFEETPAATPTLGVPELENLPDRVDLRAFCSPVEHQLNTSSCPAWQTQSLARSSFTRNAPGYR